MAVSEPSSWTLTRDQSMQDQFPVLDGTEPQQAFAVDNYAASQGKAPSAYSQQALALANRAQQEYDASEPDTAPNVTPWTPSAPTPSAQPQNSGDEYQQGLLDLARIRAGGAPAPEAQPFQGNGIGQTASNAASTLGQMATAPGTQLLQGLGVSPDTVNNLPWYVKSPLDFALNPLSLAAGPEALGAGAGAGLATGALQQVEPAWEAADPLAKYLKLPAELGVGVAGAVLGHQAQSAAPVASTWMEYANRVLADARAAEEAGSASLLQRLAVEDRGSIAPAGGEDFFAQMQAKAARGEQPTPEETAQLMNLLGERMGALPAEAQPAARDAFYNAPENLGGGQTLSPEAQANLEALAPRAQQLNTITDALANAREPNALDQIIAKNPDELPEPTRTVPSNLAQIQQRARDLANRLKNEERGSINLPGSSGAGGEEPPVPPERNEFGLTPEQVAAARSLEERQTAALQESGTKAAAGAEPFPDVPNPLQDVPPRPSAQEAKQAATTWLRQVIRNPIETLNNTARSTETLLDVAFPGRLAPTAGLYTPKTYGQAVEKTFTTAFRKDPQAEIAKAWEAFNADPEMKSRGIQASDVFKNVNEGGYGVHGAAIDPYTGEAEAGGGLGLLAPNSIGGRLLGPKNAQRVQFLQNFNQFFKPQVLREEIINRNLTVQDLQSPLLREDLGKAVDLVSGHASVRPFGDETGLLFNFGNWMTAQAETILRGATGAAQGVGNQTINRIPGVEIPALKASITNQAARTMLGRLAALGTMATVAINYANGVSPNDPRASRNGVPQVVINPKGGVQIPGFKQDTQWDLYGPLGEIIQHAAGIVGATASGFEGKNQYAGKTNGVQNSGLKGALGGLADSGFFYYRGQAGWVPRTGIDLIEGRTLGGEQPSLLNEAPIPFNVAGALEAKPRSAGVQVLSSLGGRFHEPTQSNPTLRKSTSSGAPGSVPVFKAPTFKAPVVPTR